MLLMELCHNILSQERMIRRITNDELENIWLNFQRCTNRDAAHLTFPFYRMSRVWLRIRQQSWMIIWAVHQCSTERYEPRCKGFHFISNATKTLLSLREVSILERCPLQRVVRLREARVYLKEVLTWFLHQIGVHIKDVCLKRGGHLRQVSTLESCSPQKGFHFREVSALQRESALIKVLSAQISHVPAPLIEIQ